MSKNGATLSWRRDIAVATGVGGTVALCVGCATLLLGYVGGGESRQLVEAIMPTSRLLCSSVLTVTATILALMLTILSLGASPNVDLSDSHYHRVKKIAFYDALVFAVAMTFFLLHCVPIHESKEIPDWWYPTVYYVMLSLAAVIAGAMVSIISMLYLAVRNLVDSIGLENGE